MRRAGLRRPAAQKTPSQDHRWLTRALFDGLIQRFPILRLLTPGLQGVSAALRA
jgi:hypothetical protein